MDYLFNNNSSSSSFGAASSGTSVLEEIRAGDEAAFLQLEERVVFDLYKLAIEKPEMRNMPVLDMCAKLEDLAYHNTLKEHKQPSTIELWSRDDMIAHYRQLCDTMCVNLKQKTLIDWKRLFTDNQSDPKVVLKVIMKTEQEKRYRLTAAQIVRHSSSSGLPLPAGVTPTSKPRKASLKNVAAAAVNATGKKKQRGGGSKRGKGKVAPGPRIGQVLSVAAADRGAADSGIDMLETAAVAEETDAMDTSAQQSEAALLDVGGDFDLLGFDFSDGNDPFLSSAGAADGTTDAGGSGDPIIVNESAWRM